MGGRLWRGARPCHRGRPAPAAPGTHPSCFAAATTASVLHLRRGARPSGQRGAKWLRRAGEPPARPHPCVWT